MEKLKKQTKLKLIELGDMFCYEFNINQYELLRRKSTRLVVKYLMEYLIEGSGYNSKFTSQTLNMYKYIHKIYTSTYNFRIQYIYWHTIEYFLCVYWALKKNIKIKPVILDKFIKLMRYKVIDNSSCSMSDALIGSSRYIAKPLTEKQISKIKIGEMNYGKKKMQFKFEKEINAERNRKKSTKVYRVSKRRKTITIPKKNSKKSINKKQHSSIKRTIRLKKI